MNINPVTNADFSVAENTFKAKIPNSRIKVANKVDDYVEYMLNKYGSVIENNAQAYDTVVKIAQRKDNKVNALYVNSGAITSRIDMNGLNHARDFYRGIVDNIRANSEVQTKGLKESFSRLV